jgi:amidase
MAVAAELCSKTLSAVAELIKQKDVSPLELTRAMLERIEALDRYWCSYVTVTADLALEQARRAEQEIVQGSYRGPLHGMPIAVKDLCFTKGIRTTCGSKILADWAPEYDATVVEKLTVAGAVLLGKLSLTEFAGIGYHPSVPTPVNPWDAQRWPGVSSSGSGVATAVSLCFGALGSDTGGSIRFPSAACGIVGVKPTYGKVSRFGVFPLCESLDHIGPMTRSVADAAVILRAIAGCDPRDPTTRRELVRDYLDTLYNGVKGLRVGVDEAYCTTGVDPEVSQAVLAAAQVLEDLGASLEAVKVADIEEAIDAARVIFAAEAAAAHQQTYPARADDYGPAFRALLERGAKISGAEYAKAWVVRQGVCRMLDDLFQKVDLLLCPAMPTAPMSLQDLPLQGIIPPERLGKLIRFTVPFNLTGSPTISLPCGFSAAGLPLSLQFVGRHGEEGTVLQAGYAYEQATEWHKRRPSGERT